MIVKLPDIHANNAQCKVFFTFNSEYVNKAAAAQTGMWNNTLSYSITRVFGSHSANLNATSTFRLFTFDTALPINAGTYVSCFVRLASTPTATAAVWCLYADGNNRIYLFADTLRRFKITAYSGGGIVSDAIYSSTKSINTWYQIQMYMTCDNIYMLIGTELITYTLSSCPIFNAANLGLNTTSTTTNKFPGLVDSLMVKTGVSVPISTLYNIKNRES